MDEPLIDLYYRKLNEEGNYVGVLANFVNALFGGNLTFDGDFYSRIGGMVRIYGKDRVFLSIINSIYDGAWDKDKFLNFVGYNCRKLFEGEMDNKPFNDLTDFIERNKKELERNGRRTL